MYPGDTPKKQLARRQTHAYALHCLGPRARNAAHIFLASKYGGDIQQLREFQVPDALLFGYDLDPQAILACKLQFPTVSLTNDDPAAARPPKHPYYHAFLDFCSTINPDTLATIKGVWRYMTKHSILSVGVLKGRDSAIARLHPGNKRALYIGDHLDGHQLLGTIEYRSMLICQYGKGTTLPVYGSIVH